MSGLKLASYLLEEEVAGDDFIDPSDLLQSGILPTAITNLGFKQTNSGSYKKRPLIQYQGQEVHEVDCFHTDYEGVSMPLKNTIASDPYGPVPRPEFNRVDIKVMTWVTPDWSDFQTRVEARYGNKSRYADVHGTDEIKVTDKTIKKIERLRSALRLFHPRTLNGLDKVIRTAIGSGTTYAGR